jgi:hypothetical protein
VQWHTTSGFFKNGICLIFEITRPLDVERKYLAFFPNLLPLTDKLPTKIKIKQYVSILQYNMKKRVYS